ncbi:vWA domain-containing protein [Oceanidesulfovibrio marinus]|uniref:Metallopeptidase domain-containing protein n=1 Tax=Oceanidesulfovibrio marinus TaxID=370038 RepID=A0ABX6NEG5_9BACT|nr:VWA-like domain-containing protein [Oceanidesulfovibrio marinus]QJT08999.1 hypothetical protein E8L03_08675 [Oceanidesulfovibrio marinus]
MNQAARTKMIKARSELVLDQPFFAHLALRLDLQEDPTCRTAWSDGRVLAYNPAYIEVMPLAKVKGLQCHEVLHLACGHHLRRGDRDKAMWNKACDYAINPILLDAGMELPGGYLDDPAHHGKSADAIYANLVDREESKGGAESGPEQETDAGEEAEGGTGASSGDGSECSEAGDDSAEGDGEQGAAAAAAGDEGEAPAEDAQGNDPGMTGEVRDAPPENGTNDGGADRTGEEESLQVAVAQALHKARESGELPGTLERLLSEALSPSLSWRELLRRFLDNAARNDFSWVRPNRRYLHAGLYLPGLESEELADVAVAVDVSGSITQPELDSFAAELSAVLEEFDATLTVFTCDAALTTQQKLARWDLPLDFAATGGGGTDFRPPFEQLQVDDEAPACLVYFTDMECDRFPEEPDYPVLWVTPNTDHAQPPFGEVVLMEACS